MRRRSGGLVAVSLIHAVGWLVLFAFALTSPCVHAGGESPATREVVIESSLDGTMQPSRWLSPPAGGAAAPLLVWLHTWSSDHAQSDPGDLVFAEASARGWACLAPRFRGPNSSPEACASPASRRDVLDAVGWAMHGTSRIDADRVYIAGSSGGGHMALVMAGDAPGVWAAAAASVPVVDLAAWHAFHTEHGVPGRYAMDLEAICGGAPSADRFEMLDPRHPIDAEYLSRSPLAWLHRVGHLPIRIEAGIRDGHEGSVPIDHAIRAFNAAAIAGGGAARPVAAPEIARLLDGRGRFPIVGLRADRPDSRAGGAIGRDDERRTYRPLERRSAPGGAELVLFDGSHDTDVPALLGFLSRHTRSERPEGAVAAGTGAHALRVLVLGDSNAAAARSWVWALECLHPGWTIVNRSRPGATVGFDNNGRRELNTLGSLPAIVAASEGAGPFDRIVIALGTNDAKQVFEGREPESEANLEALLDGLRGPLGARLGSPRLLVVTPPPLGRTAVVAGKYAGGDSRIERFRGSYAAIAASREIDTVDLRTLLTSEGEDVSRDGVHLTPEYQWLVARRISVGLR